MFGYQELFKFSNLIGCLNLRIIKKKEHSKYPCLQAIETSFFTQRITSYKFLIEQYNLLLEKSKSKNLNEILSNLEEEIAEKTMGLNRTINSTSSSAKNFNLNNSCHNLNSKNENLVLFFFWFNKIKKK